MEMLPLGISLGDVSGVGPEVTLKAVHAARIKRPIIVYGDENVVRTAAELCGVSPTVRAGYPKAEARSGLFVISRSVLKPRDFRPGRPSAAASLSTLKHLTAGVEDAATGRLAGLVTAPIQKEKLARIGFAYPGHTEFLAARTGAKRFAMMLAGERLRVTLVTIHCPLAKVSSQLSANTVFEKIALTHQALARWFGKPNPHIAVLGLNPHAGENGLFGDEEEKFIRPAIQRARKKKWQIDGPHPADGFFGRFSESDYDAVVCMYHDQGLIPLKLMHFWDGVNITLGLPIIRTSPDHGTAYDIAWQGVADARSMTQAILYADRFARAEGK
jgi:4-hydroxythreonine-4-phosphate dehydrogenase